MTTGDNLLIVPMIPGTALLKPSPKTGALITPLGALDALVRGLAVDLAPLRVNMVSPGAVDTEARKMILRHFHPRIDVP